MTQVVTQPIPPVPSAQSLDGKALIISQPWQQWFVNLREKVNQINSVVVNISAAGTNAAAFDLLSPLTTAGDILIYNGGHNVRVPVGSNGQILSVVSGLPAWVNPSAGSTPLTTKGDIYGYDTAPARIPVGTNSYVLTADSTSAQGVSWKPAGTPTLPLTTKGDVLGYDTAANRIPVGSNGQVLTADSTQTLGVKWSTPAATYTPPVTTKGDLFGYSTTPARVPVGTDGQVLTADSTNINGVSYTTPIILYTVPSFASVSSLLHFNGTNGSTTFTDQVAGNTWTAINATISTAQSLFGGISGLFNGASFSSIIMPTNNGFNVGSGDWTLEFSIYYIGTPQSAARLFQTRNGDVFSGISIELNTTAPQVMSLYMSSNGTAWDIINGLTLFTFPSTGWTRILIQRYGAILQVFANGAFVSTNNIAGSVYYNSADSITIGGNASGTSRSINAYLDEFRFTKGQALVHSYMNLQRKNF